MGMGSSQDAAIVAQLMAMGFSENGSRRAALATSNAGADAAMEWVFAHMEEPGFNDPLPAATTAVPMEVKVDQASGEVSLGFIKKPFHPPHLGRTSVLNSD
jgi:uncharacterized UBP type Zn finger protein